MLVAGMGLRACLAKGDPDPFPEDPTGGGGSGGLNWAPVGLVIAIAVVGLVVLGYLYWRKRRKKGDDS